MLVPADRSRYGTELPVVGLTRQVLDAHLDRVHPEFGRQLVHHRLHREGRLRVPRRAHRPVAVERRVHRVDARVRILDAIDVGRGRKRASGHPTALVGLHVQGDDAPVPIGAGTHHLTGPGAVAGHQELLGTVHHQVHRSSERLGDLAGDSPLESDPELGAEAAPHVLAHHPHLRRVQPERPGEAPRVVRDGLGARVDRGLVPAPEVDHASVGLEARVVLDGSAVLGLDHHERALQGTLGGVLVPTLPALPDVPAARQAGCVLLRDLLAGDQGVVLGRPVDAHGARGVPRLLRALGSHHGDDRVVPQVAHQLLVLLDQRRMHDAGQGLRWREVDALDPRPGPGQKDQTGVDHARKTHVVGVACGPGDLRDRVDARERAIEDGEVVPVLPADLGLHQRPSSRKTSSVRCPVTSWTAAKMWG